MTRRRSGRLRSKRIGVLALAVTALGSVGVAPAAAVPARAVETAARVDSIERIDNQLWYVHVFSPSMNRVIPLQVLRPADTDAPRPTLYLLNGSSGGEGNANWLQQTDARSFFADKNVNVVVPLEGESSYYTDWIEDDPAVGRNRWATFLTRELPPVIDVALGADGVNAIAGMSMAATSVFNLAIQAPHLYRGVASYSGCAQTSDPIGQAFVRTVVELRGGADATRMWGPYDGPLWEANDPFLNAEKLRGLSLYVSSATGKPGRYENPALAPTSDMPTLIDQALVGGVIEAATNMCTHRLADRLEELKIPATVNILDKGTHSWGYMQDQLHASWPQLASSLGL